MLRPTLALAALLGSACAHDASSRSHTPASWIDADLTGERAREDEELEALAAAGPRGRVVRLDRLLDLFDAARFGADEGARESLWTALGGHPTGVGERATRDALSRLLAEAMALDAALSEDARAGDAPESDRRLVADAIMLLTTDLEPPGSAEDLAVRTLAYRTLVERGHPRIADNARWRLYDHVRGTLAGATQASPDARLDVAVQALYAERESLEDLLSDAAPHARPAWPALAQLWAPLTQQTRALAEDPRWREVVRTREADDATLHDTLVRALPAVRASDWPLVRLPAGTAKAESLAPIVRIDADGSVVVDDGRPGARVLTLEDAQVEAIADAIRAALVADGRGAVLLVADPGTPAPRVHALLRAIRRASVDRIELAVHEPRLRAEAAPAVLALGLLVARDGVDGTAQRAAASARVHVHLGGRGPVFALDGVTLRDPASDGAALARRLDDIGAAYPGERMVRLTLDADVQLRQLVELLAALEGGPARRFAAVAWQPGASAPAPASAKASADATLATRAEIGRTAFGFTLERPFPLVADDDARLVELVEQLSVCMPELAASVPRGGVTLTLPFSEGGLAPVKLGKLSAPARGQADFKACIDERVSTFRLRHHRDTMAIDVTIQPTG